MIYRRSGKRAVDLMLTLPALLLLSPLLLILAILIKVRLGSPILFRQTRAGVGGRSFVIYKFRTMRETYDTTGCPLPDRERLTTFGSFLRRTSLDELPELVNVLKGDMSLVGPRPLFEKYLPHYSEREAARHLVRPGITGLAQVSGRNALTWDRRLELDALYVENVSLWLDLRIMLSTITAVLKQAGIDTDPRGSMQDLDEERRDNERRT